MKNTLILILKGFMIGIGKIIPGVSGSLLAIIFNVYEDCLERISHIFHHFKDNVFFLGKLSLGIFVAFLLGSRVLVYFLNHYYFYTMLLIIGLILGVIPGIYKQTKVKSIKDIFLFLIPIFLIFILESKESTSQFMPTNELSSFLTIVWVGILEAITTIVPGISGTATFMILGYYYFILELFSNPFTIYLPFYLFGLIIGVYLVSFILNLLFKKYHQQLYLIIVSLTIGSLYLLTKQTLSISFNIYNLVVGIILFIIGLISSYFLNK